MAWSNASMRSRGTIVASRLRRRSGVVRVVAGLTIVGAFASVRVLAAEIPSLKGRITDDANVLGLQARQRLTAALKAHEDATGNQIAVLTIPTLDGEPVDRYANRVFASWKLGRKG